MSGPKWLETGKVFFFQWRQVACVNKYGRFHVEGSAAVLLSSKLSFGVSTVLADNIPSSNAITTTNRIRNRPDPTTYIIRICQTPRTHVIWKMSAPTTDRKIYRLPSSPPRYLNRSVWPTLFLLNVSTALKGTHNYISISHNLAASKLRNDIQVLSLSGIEWLSWCTL